MCVRVRGYVRGRGRGNRRGRSEMTKGLLATHSSRAGALRPRELLRGIESVGSVGRSGRSVGRLVSGKMDTSQALCLGCCCVYVWVVLWG